MRARFPRFRALRVALVCAALALPGFSLSQATQGDALQKALDEARRELAAEQARISTEESAQRARLAELVAERDTLSDRRVDLELGLDPLRADVSALRDERGALRADVDAAESETTELPRMIRDAGDKIVDLLEVLPPSEPRFDPAAVEADDLDGFLDGLAGLLADGQSNGFYSGPVVLADGASDEAEFLRVGLFAWVFRARTSGRVGIAMSAPGLDATFRWYEDLTPDAKRDIAAALDARSSGATAALFPLDPTMQMETESTTRQKTFATTVMAGGPVMIPLSGVAVLAALLILERLFFLLRKGGGSTRVAERIVECASEGDVEGALEICRKKQTPVTRAMNACLVNRDRGQAAMEDAVQEAVMHELPRLERFLPTIAILASVAPLLGLLGTVTGMILTFEMIATLGSGNPRIMAGGISQALLTTAAGLVVAIPILLTHSFLSGRVDRVIADMERFAAMLLNLMRKDG